MYFTFAPNTSKCNIRYMQLAGTIASTSAPSGKVAATSAILGSYDTYEGLVFPDSSHTATSTPRICKNIDVAPNRLSYSVY